LAVLAANWPGIDQFSKEKAMNENSANQIQLFKSAFKGREDVFAIRWEKADKNGYMPAYPPSGARFLNDKNCYMAQE
jgi:hypothetical protein